MPRPDRLSDDTIGRRVHRVRSAHPGWSLRVVAERAGISKSTLSAIERGDRSVNNRYLVADLAAALECSVSDITGEPYMPADRQLEAAHGKVATLRRVLVNAASDEPPMSDLAPRPMPLLEQLCAQIDSRWDRYDYAGLGELLTHVIPDLHAVGRAGDPRAIELLLKSSRAATATFEGLGYPGDMWIAADRCRDVARWLGDPVAVSVAEIVWAFTAIRCVSYERAYTLTGRAIDAIQPYLAQPDALSVLGVLHLTATRATMGLHRPEEAFGHIGEAEAIVKRASSTDPWQLSFGPANTAVWRMGLEIDAGRLGNAVETARVATAGVVGLPPSRQSAFYMDLARALAGNDREHDRAVRALLTAERLAPQHVRSSPMARETARSIAETARRNAVGSNLRGFCERVGLAL